MSLYKYVTPERLDVLENLHIRFTQPFALNDPFEVQPLIRSIVSPEMGRQLLSSEIDRLIQLRFTKDVGDPDAVSLLKTWNPKGFDGLKEPVVTQGMKVLDHLFPFLRDTILATLGTQIGILSLTETPANPLMWAHYAANYAGFVYEFDDTHPWFHARKTDQDDFHHLRRVVYVDPEAGCLSELGATEIFYSKGTAWEYEQEWRMIAHVAESSLIIQPDIYLFQIPPECFLSVLCGHRVHYESVQRLAEILCRPHFSHVKTLHVQISSETRDLEVVSGPPPVKSLG